MAKYVQMAVPEEHVMAVYRYLLGLEEQREESDEADAQIGSEAGVRTKARTAENIRAQDYAP